MTGGTPLSATAARHDGGEAGWRGMGRKANWAGRLLRGWLARLVVAAGPKVDRSAGWTAAAG
jgi:hypothetical protein